VELPAAAPPPIELDITNMAALGFARFHYPGEHQLDNGEWRRTIVMAHTTEGQVAQEIRIPESLLISLERARTRRLYAHADFTVTRTTVMLDPLRLLSHRSGWNQTQTDLSDLTKLDTDGCFLASLGTPQGRISLGTGLVLPVGQSLAWIGMILVHPEVRRQGIARAIMEQCLDYALLGKGYTVNGLDARAAGREVYQTMGYRSSFRVWRCQLDLETATRELPDLSGVQRLDTCEQAIVYEAARKFYDRKDVLRTLYHRYPDGCFLRRRNGAPAGYVFSRPGRLYPAVGPLIADDPDIARELLLAVARHWKTREFTHVFVDTPEMHFQTPPADVTVSEQGKPAHHILLPALTPLRWFDRMYQAVAAERIDEFIEWQGEDAGHQDTWKKLFNRAADNYHVTVDHLNRERDDMLPLIFATTGPELG